MSYLARRKRLRRCVMDERHSRWPDCDKLEHGPLENAKMMEIRTSILPVCFLVAGLASAQNPRKPDVAYVPTTNDAVEAMLKLADVTSSDTVYDLGCGDGRIVVAAAKLRGARGVGIDIDPVRVSESRANAKKAGVE